MQDVYGSFHSIKFKKLFELIGPYEFAEYFGETFAW